MSNAAPTPAAALRLAKRLIDEALPCFNWSQSALTADAIRLLTEVPSAVEAALAAIESAEATDPPKPRARGPLTAAEVEALRLDLGAGTLFVLGRDHQSRAFGALSAAAAGSALIEPETAHALWSAFTAQARDEASHRRAAGDTPPPLPTTRSPEP